MKRKILIILLLIARAVYGHAVYSEGDFKRIKKKVPDFFIDISGEETRFKDLNWEDWWDWE